MEESFSICCIKKINCIADVADIKYKKTKYSKTCLSIPPTHKLYNNNKNTTPAVKKIAQSAKALGMSLTQSVTKGKAGQYAATSTPVLSNADSGATGNINILRDVRVSSPAEQIAVAVADGNLPKSTHHGFLDVDDVRVGRAHSDATGALPQRGRTGALYQIVFYHEDSNKIHIETSKSRTGNDLLAVLQRAV